MKQVQSLEGITDEVLKSQYKLVRHGYGLQLFSGQRNSDGVITKYEGYWDRDQKTSQKAIAVFKDGSIYQGAFSHDHLEGTGRYEWAHGHIYEGPWKDSQMEGSGGSFVHSNGRSYKDQTFKRNYLVGDKGCMVNPIEEDKRQRKVMKVFEEQVLGQKEKILYERRLRVFQVKSPDEMKNALLETRQMSRIPLFVRTPKNNLVMKDVVRMVADFSNIPSESESINEINLRRIFSESFGNPLKKNEQRDKLNALVKKAILNSQLIVLNFDDYEYSESVLDSQNKISSAKEDEQHQVFAIGYDPNIKEFSGSRAFPAQLWTPQEIIKRRDLMESIGLINAEDEIVPDFKDNIHFMVWSKLQLKSKLAQRQIVERVVGQQKDDLSQGVTADTIKEAYYFDEVQLNEAEILEKVEKRFAKSLPLDCINLILLQEFA